MRPRLAIILAVSALLIALAALVRHRLPSARSADPAMALNTSQEALVAKVVALQRSERQLDETKFAAERRAEQYGAILDQLWDAVNASSNKFEPLASFPGREWIFPNLDEPQPLPHGMTWRESRGAGERLDAAKWRAFLQAASEAGWRLEQAELRHNGIQLDAAGQPRQSRYWLSAHLLNTTQNERAMLEGDLLVEWGDGPSVRGLDASRLRLTSRKGEPFLQLAFDQEFQPPEKSHFIDPLILYDLDGDGASEIVLAARNVVLQRRAWDRFESRPLLARPPGPIFTGMIADFDGDGHADFLCARFEGLYLFPGSATGTIDAPGRLVWRAEPRLKYAQFLTCGDIDGDGDLDVWLGQYRLPYERGSMPSPWDDANDGHPSYLLVNDGQGNFTDGTVAAGLAARRHRRAYSGSFLDLNGDGRP
ncbi:MAG TPA: VCBS repeat-containing protein, partial [Verrucomicrobiae bacterium]|nr:VCBS repeat-containing protein [Verrucomicrobiae bacterium]